MRFNLTRVGDEISISDGASSAAFDAATGVRIRGSLSLPPAEVLFMAWRQRQGPRLSDAVLRSAFAKLIENPPIL